MIQFFDDFEGIVNQISDATIKDNLYLIYSQINDCGDKMASATKFIDFFVHDILDYTMLNKDDKNFIKNTTIFSVKDAVDEIVATLHDKVKMKQIQLKVKLSGFKS